MIDTAKERPFTFYEFGRLAEIDRHESTVREWTESGRWNRGRTKRIILESVKTSAGMCTSLEAYHRWIRRLNGDEP